jgi:hypothetical protein
MSLTLQANNELIRNILWSLLISLCSFVCRKFLVLQNVAPSDDDFPALRDSYTVRQYETRSCYEAAFREQHC